MLELGDEECIRFRQAASMDKIEGQLLVTDVRIHWSSTSGDVPDFQTPWPSIIKTQYCEPSNPKMKGKAGIKLDLSTGKVKSAMFMLQGGDKVSQLEVLKGVVRKYLNAGAEAGDVRSSFPAPISLATGSGTGTDARMGDRAGTKRARPTGDERRQDILDRNSQLAQQRALLQQRRQELLAADSTLAKFYKDLCGTCTGTGNAGGGGILTVEEFWEAHMPEYASQLDRRDADDYTQKGRIPLKSRITAGGGRLNLTRDDILQILEEDPITRRAHADLVPHQKSEKDFWQLYINKFYHRTDVGRSSQADQLFARYERKTPTTTSSQMTLAQRQALEHTRTGAGTSTSESTSTGYGKATGKWTPNSQFDLLDSLADKTNTNITERFDAEDSTHIFKDSLHKIVEDSLRVVLPSCQGNEQGQGPRQGQGEREQAIVSLQTYQPPSYVKLNINLPSTGTGTGTSSESIAAAANVVATAPVKKSGFGKATLGASTAATGTGTAGGGMRGIPRAQSSPILSIHNTTPASLLLNLHLFALPSPSQAITYVQNNRLALREMSHFFALTNRREETSARLEKVRDYEAFGIINTDKPTGTGEDDMTGEIGSTGTDIAYDEGWQLPTDFKNEMKETFGAISEYLRHFYSLLSREGDAAPVPDSAAAVKVTKIIAHLDLTTEKLVSKKQRYKAELASSSTTTSFSTAMIGIQNKNTSPSVVCSAMVHVIDEILRMLTRVKAVWATYCKKFISY